MIRHFATFSSILFAASPVYAQVIDISADGEAVIYASPTVFVNEGDRIFAERPVEAFNSPAQGPASLAASVAQMEREYQLPPGLVDAVIYQESRGRVNAVSLKGALGLMQLMPGTAAQLGVNPYNAAENIRGGALYLRQQLDRFGSIPLALAAYNAGPGAVLRYGGIPPFRETQNYVTSILGRWKPPVQPVAMEASKGDKFASIDETTVFLIEVTEP